MRISHCKKCVRDTERDANGECKACARREKWRAASSKYYAANSDKVRAATAAYRAANPEKHRAAAAAWTKANPEKVRVKMVAYWKANPEMRRTNRQNYRARKQKNGGTLSAGLTEKLFKLQRGKCACGCKQPLGTDFHRDHIMPLALGGTNTDDNIQLLRSTCNQQKHAKHPVEFMQQRGYLL